MDCVVMERLLDSPVALDDVRAMEGQATWCLDQHRVRHLTSLLSADGRRLTCVFVAPDAEAVRSAARRLEAPYEGIWPASAHGPADLPVAGPLAPPGTDLVVVERRFAAPVELGTLQAAADGAAWCFDQHRVHHRRTYFARDRRAMLCLYAAADAESVRAAQRQAGMPFEEVWSARFYETLD